MIWFIVLNKCVNKDMFNIVMWKFCDVFFIVFKGMLLGLNILKNKKKKLKNFWLIVNIEW